jgi:hypothetical protein
MDAKGAETIIETPATAFRLGQRPHRSSDSLLQVSLRGIPALRQANKVELPTAGEQKSADPRTEAGLGESPVGVCEHSWGLHPQEAGAKGPSRVAQSCCQARGSVVRRLKQYPSRMAASLCRRSLPRV